METPIRVQLFVEGAKTCRSEAQWQTTVEHYLNAAGCEHWHISDSRRMTKRGPVGDGRCAGLPDLFIANPRRGWFKAIELKYGKGKPTERQRATLDTLTKSGVPSYVFWPDDAAELARIIEG